MTWKYDALGILGKVLWKMDCLAIKPSGILIRVSKHHPHIRFWMEILSKWPKIQGHRIHGNPWEWYIFAYMNGWFLWFYICREILYHSHGASGKHPQCRSVTWHRHTPPQQRRLAFLGEKPCRFKRRWSLDRAILRNLVSCEYLYITHHYPNLGCGFNGFFGTFATKIASVNFPN